MNAFDVFNGDADGICALHQLRLHEPREAELVTGVKRDIGLLERLADVSDARITVLDISIMTNRAATQGLLERGCELLYFDHHFAGEPLEHAALEAHIDTSADVCTSLLVDRYLDGAYRAWAVTAAFGDNLVKQARAAAKPLDLTAQELEALHTLGELLNYNSYGDSLEDLHIPPAELYRSLRGYEHPLTFLSDSLEAENLLRGFTADMVRANRSKPIYDGGAGRVFRFPNLVWARRVVGVYANRLSAETPERATALVVPNPDGSLRISVRAPEERPSGADTLCMAFPTGGGRTAAAGINQLPEADLPKFLEAFQEAFQE
ncbi:MAG: DHH family phosphoesterase [SAR324 cluster bacterium]|nr:DHH family phosphoesterase [SAR324 cluster bacterium]